MPKAKKSDSYFNKIEADIRSNQSTLSLVLGALIVVVVGILLFNYFNRQEPQITPTSETQEVQPSGDVSPHALPGKYTVKEGDTLFSVAQTYYNDGYKYEEIAKSNNLTDVNTVTVGQELTIPKLEGVAAASASPTASADTTSQVQATSTPSAAPLAEVSPSPTQVDTGQGTGGTNITAWGPRIEGDSYTVVEGDWLSTIAGRAYGDILAYTKIAEANNIANPDLITPGTVLKIPR